MKQKIFVQPGEYQFSSKDDPKLLITERLGEDIAFSVYNPITQCVVLARMVSVNEVYDIITKLNSGKDCNVRLQVQFVGGVYKGGFNPDGSPNRKITESPVYQHCKALLDAFSTNHDILDKSIFHKEHPDSVSVYPTTGLLKPYGREGGLLQTFPGVTFPSGVQISKSHNAEQLSYKTTRAY